MADGVPGGIRTHDPLLRRQVLYPTELQAQRPFRDPSKQLILYRKARLFIKEGGGFESLNPGHAGQRRALAEGLFQFG